MTVSLSLGYILWKKRNEVPDISRTFLAIMSFFFGFSMMSYILALIFGLRTQSTVILDPVLCIGGIYGIACSVYYPIEVMRPRWIKGWRTLIPLIPGFIISSPLLFGLHFQNIVNLNDIAEHWKDFDVLLRLISLATIGLISITILFIPYNWRKSSADLSFVRRYVFLLEGITVFYFGNCLIINSISADLHYLWICFVISIVTYYELKLRVIAPVGTQDLPDEPEQLSYEADDNQADDLWQRINHQMNEHEIWRNPDVTVEMMSRAVGTNRIYVADCIREHTGLTFNDFLNKWRTEYMADKLRQNPTQDQKPLYFEIGYRNRQTAYRNFIKFIGCSPSDFAASI